MDLAAGTEVIALISVSDLGELQDIETLARVESIWIDRRRELAVDPTPFLHALSKT